MKLENCITTDNMNRNLLNIEYAVRGPIVQRAKQIEREMEKGVPKLFPRVIYANIGDCHALGQTPITFIRQILALVSCPYLIECDSYEFPSDVKNRAKELLAACTQASIGSYSPFNGLPLVRERVAQYITSRDGFPASSGHVYLGSGASDLVKSVLTLFAGDCGGKPSAVMIPIPQYPLFSGTLSELGIKQAPYYLDEANGWSLKLEELERSYQEASTDSWVRALVVINPGNPTGQVLSRSNVEQVIKFAYERRLFLLADEVYQANITSKPFHSFKKVMKEMGAPYSSMELASFLTCSKGWAAECGLRGGYCELVGIKEDVKKSFDAMRGVMQCPSVLGQCVLDCVMAPPQPGEPSYNQFLKETRNIHCVLTERTELAYRTFNSIPGYSCNVIDGAMFAFPRVHIPPSAQLRAQQLGLTPDQFYCLQLLEETGLCVVPGTGFGQQPGTFHFRTTILHPEDEFQYMMETIANFHIHFMSQFPEKENVQR